MIGAIAGDIIGSRFEGHPAPPAGFELFHPHCRFTDDTVCSLAVAEALHGVPDHIGKRAREHLTEDLRQVLDRFEERRAAS